MKHGKRPTRVQKAIIKAWSLNWENWLVTKDTPGELEIVHKHTGNTRKIKKAVK